MMFFRSTQIAVLLALIVTLVGAPQLSAGGSSSSNEDLEDFTGRIAVKGTEPHTFVSLTTDDGTEYRLRGEPVAELRAEHQNTVISVRGRVLDSPGAPMPASLEVVSFSVQ